MFHYSKIAVLAVVLAIAGCNAVPILNVKDAAVTSASGKAMSNAEVRAAILRAGAALGWQMRDEGSNMLVGTILLRDHTAVIEIPYSPSNYSIKYRSSTNLKESGGNIHKNYNGWIQNLTRGINAQLTAS
ncbi:MAG: hypothetical protein WBK51_13695 [Polaromonas sp.]